MKVLVSGARAPSCLEISRQLKLAGNEVFVSDCTSLTLSRFSNQFSGYLEFSSPRFEFERFKNDIEMFVHTNEINLVIPTCEEVFYLSRLKSEMKKDVFFCDEFAKLKKLHSKMDFATLSKKWTLQTPETIQLEGFASWEKLNLKQKDFVFKPVFSRFATQTLIDVKEETLRAHLSIGDSWVAQRRVVGKEICLYAICVKGKVTAFASYMPIYRAGLGAGVYLEPFYSEALVQFVESFAEDQKFHGQVAFDVIHSLESGKFELLECNPRATSGVHFFGPELSKAITGETKNIVFGDRSYPRMVAAAMVIYGAPWASLDYKKWKKFFEDYRRASDVVWDWKDLGPYVGQYLSFAGFIGLALKLGVSPISVSSRDIEYNG